MNQHVSSEAALLQAASHTLNDYPHVHYVHEMAGFRFILRDWVSTIGLPPGYAANNAEHAFNVITIGVLIGTMEKLPMEQLGLIAIGGWAHDLPERRTKDQDPTTRKYVKANEKKALAGILKRVNPYLRKVVNKVFYSYKARETIVDRIIKSADIIDSVREVIEWKRKGIPYLDCIPNRIQQKRERLQELGVPSAIELFEDLMTTGPDYVWSCTLLGDSTFTDNKYGK